jgi:transposase
MEAVFLKTLYRERNQVERFFSKLKHQRRMATRYDKLASMRVIALMSRRQQARA